ncbi:MAG: aminotransferase class V-fold PLP-dependent enzyme [Vicinamibacterales bacterium]|nr:aminotransferase class V-fold PLP-dependent enzyme [Vicinamibacterales bacterium]
MRLSRRRFLTQSTLAGAIGFMPGAALGQSGRPAAGALAPFAPAAGEADAAVFAAARKRLLFPDTVTYCNTGTLGASPWDVVAAMNQRVESLERALPDWPYFQADGEPLTGYQQLLDARTKLGAFINAAPDEVAITLNATMGMSFLANGLDLAAGDEVVTTDQEHSGGIGSWRLRAKRHGVVVKELPLLPAVAEGPEAVVKLFADAMTPRTRVIMFSHITSGLGILMPARELCALAHDRGALAIVDGAQVIGQRRLDVRAIGCDAYVSSPHKWLLAPKGTGVLYIRRDVQPRVWVTLASGRLDADETGAFRFMQYGTGSVPVVDGLMAALQFIEAIGIDRIERWDLMLANRLRDGLARIKPVRLLSPADRRLASAIATFAVSGVTGRALQDALWDKQIRVRAQGQTVDRPVRLSAHLYVSPADIDRVLDVVAALRA